MKQKRQDQVDAGAYDGRFKERVVQDKKKEERKRKARRWRHDKERTDRE